jgi:quercetin dioxygenase-like cupin family protein
MGLDSSMDVQRVTSELREAFPHGRLLGSPQPDAGELIELEPGSVLAGNSRVVAVIERIPGNFNRRSTLTFTVLRGTLTLFPHGQPHVLDVGDTCQINPHVFFWAEADEAWVEVVGSPPVPLRRGLCA